MYIAGKKKGKTNIPGGGSLSLFGGEGVKMSRWDTGTRPPILDKIKRNSKPPSLRTADAFPVVASEATIGNASAVHRLQTPIPHRPPPPKSRI